MLDFGNQRAQFHDLDDRGRTTLRHLLLSIWETGMEVPPYPLAGGKYAVYTFDDLKKHINFAVEKYYTSPNDAIGIYMMDGRNDTADRAVTFCVNYFTYDSVELGHGKHKAEIHDICFKCQPTFDGENYSYDIVADLKDNNMSESTALKSFLSINLTFHLFSLRLDSLSGSGRCLSIQGIISFNDKDNNGQALVDLQTDTGQKSCKDINVDLPDMETIIEFHMANSVIGFSLLSLLLMIVDLLPAGICLCYVKWRLNRLDEYAIWLGIGCLLCWICLSRYIHFNEKFHTMYHAIPHVLAYLICLALLFLGFTLCGYVVLGPYHIKAMSKAAETLFSTISGDEIYMTLVAIETDKLGSRAVGWFAQIYLGLFVSIFTIVILNILIAIFNSAYEVFRSQYEEETDLIRRVLHELLHTNGTLHGSIREVKNALLQILNRQDNSVLSPREYLLRQELKAVRKLKIEAFMEGGGERLNKHLSCWKVRCIIPKEDTEV